MKRILPILLLLCAMPAMAATWYVNPTTGGTRWSATNTSGQCNGQSSTPYVSGTNQNCPYNDFRYLWNDPSIGGNRAWVIAHGDTVMISGYEQSTGLLGAIAGVSDGLCVGVGQCYMPSIPTGTALAPTKILGANFASCGTGVYGGDPAKVEYLAVVESSGALALAVNDSQYVDIECLNINGEGSNSNHGVFNGNNGNPRNAANITLKNVTLQGFKGEGIFGPIAGPYTLTDVELYMNSLSGWNFDDGNADLSSGSVTANFLGVDWSGCQQEWPLVHTIPVASGGCRDDSSLGYGDGIGTAATPLDFSCDQCRFTYNTQDASDFVHVASGAISITRSYYAGNMGGNIKIGAAFPVTVNNNTVVGNCYRMSSPITGAQTGFNTNLSDYCRAAGDQNSANASPNAEYVGNAFAVGTAVTGTDTHFTTQLAVGNVIAPADFSFSTYGGISVASITDDTHLTVSGAYPTNWGSSGSPLHLLYVPGGTPSSSTTIDWNFNSNVGYGATQIDGGCLVSHFAGGGYGGPSADMSYCPGFTFNFKDNLSLGIIDSNCPGTNGGCGNGTIPPGLFFGITPSAQDYNLYWNLQSNSANCVGVHDLCLNPLFTSQPPTTITTESQLDNFNFYPTGASPAVDAGLTISGITIDYYGVTRPSPPSIGAVEPSGVTPTAATPTFSPVAGTYTGSQSVTISTTSAGAILCYNTTGSPATNGTTGCTTGTLYSGPVTVSSSETLFAVAGGTGWLDSSVGSAAYTITTPTVATPTASPVAGTYVGTQSVSLSTVTSGAAVCYTLDGTTPTATTPGTCDQSTYSTALSIASTTTIKAIGTKSGDTNSGVFSGLYTITAPPTVTFSLQGTASITGQSKVGQ